MTNAPIDPLVIIELTNLKAAGKLEELAKHPSLAMKPEWMGELAANTNWLVRYWLASNPALISSANAVTSLVRDGDYRVRWSLAQNPAIANYPEVIQTRAARPCPSVGVPL